MVRDKEGTPAFQRKLLVTFDQDPVCRFSFEDYLSVFFGGAVPYSFSVGNACLPYIMYRNLSKFFVSDFFYSYI
jgi:hypothetical protein